MKYNFHTEDKPIIDRILELNNIDRNSLNVSDFKTDTDIDIINEFKEKLLSYKDKHFLIVGDFDCDGICATTIMKKLLDDLNIKNNYYIPSRIKEGYGLNNDIVQKAKDNNIDCLILVDNGVVAHEQLSLCKQYQIPVFIIDHHEYTDMPECELLLHPRMFADKYADMCAGGLSALISNSFKYDELNDVYGGLATLADMVSVLNYNRYIMNRMIEIIKKGEVYPINYLLGNDEVSYQTLRFNVIPKINAVSRLDEYINVNMIVKYLLAGEKECIAYYETIEENNRARKRYTKQMQDLAYRNIEDSKIIMMKSTEFKEGLCGLLANKILSKYHKPVILFAQIDDMLKGSARSMPETNIYEYLSKCSDLFETFGGHCQAVGLSMKLGNYVKLQEYINNNPIEYHEIEKNVLILNTDDIDEKTISDIELLDPFGTDFVKPLFGLDIEYRNKYIVGGRFPKYIVSDKLSAISFNPEHADKEFTCMIGNLEPDTYSKGKLSFVIEDLV